MPDLIHRLARRRAARTGENLGTAHRAVYAAVERLTLDECRFLRAAPRCQVPPNRLRQAVLPDATGAQAILETALLMSLRYVEPGTPSGDDPSYRVIRWASPAPESLLLKLRPHALVSFLAAVLPYRDDWEFRGVAGLRARPSRRHVRLFLLDHPETTGVMLAGVTRREWTAALTAVMAQKTDDGIDNWLLPPADTFMPGERDAIAEAWPRTATTAHLGSGLLRRIGSLRDAAWVDLWWGLCHGIHLDWPADPSRRQEVAELLTDPLVGLPGQGWSFESAYGNDIRVASPEGPGCRRCGDSTSLLMLRHSAPDSDGRS
jgi:hypothetical protein